jgi:DNA-binding transcriptional LysR family regulator
MEWDDLRFVLAVARTGSAMRAARELGVDQTTVLRKLDLLETTLGTSLFERRKNGTDTHAGRTFFGRSTAVRCTVPSAAFRAAARRYAGMRSSVSRVG